MIIQIVAVVIVWYLLWLGIGQIPEPSAPSKPPVPVKAILYVLDCGFAAYLILKIAGLV